MKIKAAFLSALAFVLVGTGTTLAGSISWSAATDNGIANANGIKLAPGSLLLIGTFDISDATIQANSGNIAFLTSHFAQYGSSSIGTNVGGLPGFFAQNSVGTFDTTTPFPVGGGRIDIWAFNSASIGTATQQGIFSLTTSTEWIFPHDTDVVTTRTIDITDLTNGAGTSLVAGADIVIGAFQQGPGNTLDFNLAAIPEPSTYALALFGGLILFFFLRRSASLRA